MAALSASHPSPPTGQNPDSVWARVATLRPRLPPHVRTVEQHYRGRPVYVLEDDLSGRQYRLDAAAHGFVRLLDGHRSVEVALRELGGSANRERQITALLDQLHRAGLLHWDLACVPVDAVRRKDETAKRQARQRWARPLALRVPLLNPDRFLSRTAPWIAALFNRCGFALWLVFVMIAGVLALAHLPALNAHWAARGLDPVNVVLLVLAYPLVKALHELGHAFATKVWGGAVREMGIVLLVLMPIPYVDATAANGFQDKRRRMAVAGAGIMVELALAGAAMFAWLALEPGLARDFAFDVMLIGGVSTVLFNGNPLARFDGYYVLADYLEIPNLASRSGRYLAYLCQRHLLGVRAALSPVEAPGERGWFVVYGIGAGVYRLVVGVAIALYIAGKFFVVGVLLALWVVAVQLLLPLGRALRFVAADPALRGRRRRALSLLGGVVVAAATLLAVPLPHSNAAEGIVRMPETSLVRAKVDGFVAGVLKDDGARVAAQQRLFQLTDPRLATRVEILEARRRELLVRRQASLLADRVQAQVLADELETVQAELEEARAAEQALTVVSPTAGSFVVDRPQNLLGRYVQKGHLLGYVADPQRVDIRVVVPQAAVDAIRRDTQSVRVRLVSRPGVTLAARIERIVPLATGELPDRSLGSQGGGAIAVDGRDTTGRTTMEHVFQLDLALEGDAGEAGRYIGARVMVRFEHGREALAERGYRWLRDAARRRFGW